MDDILTISRGGGYINISSISRGGSYIDSDILLILPTISIYRRKIWVV